ncbi:MAG: class I SAM-dependent methyltransferase, partial [Verrucomicrobiae bacterium]|nr:class I SAM-dependent methyltransferase [Verrucomicrobiae bacterium]
MTDEDIWRFLSRTDEELLSGPVESIHDRIPSPLWPTWLDDDIATRVRDVHWAVERHYGQRVRESYGDDVLLDKYLTIAYIRVVDLVLRYEENMGFTLRGLAFIRRALRPVGYRGAVMDIGCGTGALLAALASAGYRNLHGIDMSPSSVTTARKRLGSRIPVVVAEPQDVLQWRGPGCLDAAIMGDVLEHIPPQRVVSFLMDVRKLVSEGGR